MNPTRRPIHANGTLHLRQRLLIAAGTILTVMGFAALTLELWRWWFPLAGAAENFRWKHFLVAAALTISGLILIQTMNVFDVLAVAYKVWQTRITGGRRWTDPPPETAPPPLPKEKWPTPDPLWRDPLKRTRRDD